MLCVSTAIKLQKRKQKHCGRLILFVSKVKINLQMVEKIMDIKEIEVVFT